MAAFTVLTNDELMQIEGGLMSTGWDLLVFLAKNGPGPWLERYCQMTYRRGEPASNCHGVFSNRRRFSSNGRINDERSA